MTLDDKTQQPYRGTERRRGSDRRNTNDRRDEIRRAIAHVFGRLAFSGQRMWLAWRTTRHNVGVRKPLDFVGWYLLGESDSPSF